MGLLRPSEKQVLPSRQGVVAHEKTHLISGTVKERQRLKSANPGNRKGGRGYGKTELWRNEMVRVLVCGGRNYHDNDAVARELNEFDRKHGIISVLHGGASGADRLAKRWALDLAGKPALQMDAPWNKYGPRAGPIRNSWMLDYGKPDAVIAFPGGNGTADMVAKAKAQGIDVIEIQ